MKHSLSYSSYACESHAHNLYSVFNRCASDNKYTYSGEYCTEVAEKLALSSTKITIIAAGAGGGVVLILVVALVVTCLKKRQKAANPLLKTPKAEDQKSV